MDSIKNSIETALEEIKDLPEDERKKQIKALRLRWHPDKNPVLTEFATEVSKIINGAVSVKPLTTINCTPASPFALSCSLPASCLVTHTPTPNISPLPPL